MAFFSLQKSSLFVYLISLKIFIFTENSWTPCTHEDDWKVKKKQSDFKKRLMETMKQFDKWDFCSAKKQKK